MRNWHIGRDKENLVFTKKGRKIMRKIKRKKGYAGKMQEKIFEQIRMNEIIEKKKKSDIILQSRKFLLTATANVWNIRDL